MTSGRRASQEAAAPAGSAGAALVSSPEGEALLNEALAVLGQTSPCAKQAAAARAESEAACKAAAEDALRLWERLRPNFRTAAWEAMEDALLAARLLETVAKGRATSRSILATPAGIFFILRVHPQRQKRALAATPIVRILCGLAHSPNLRGFAVPLICDLANNGALAAGALEDAGALAFLLWLATSASGAWAFRVFPTIRTWLREDPELGARLAGPGAVAAVTASLESLRFRLATAVTALNKANEDRRSQRRPSPRTHRSVETAPQPSPGRARGRDPRLRNGARRSNRRGESWRGPAESAVIVAVDEWNKMSPLLAELVRSCRQLAAALASSAAAASSVRAVLALLIPLDRTTGIGLRAGLDFLAAVLREAADGRRLAAEARIEGVLSRIGGARGRELVEELANGLRMRYCASSPLAPQQRPAAARVIRAIAPAASRADAKAKARQPSPASGAAAKRPLPMPASSALSAPVLVVGPASSSATPARSSSTASTMDLAAPGSPRDTDLSPASGTMATSPPTVSPTGDPAGAGTAPGHGAPKQQPAAPPAAPGAHRGPRVSPPVLPGTAGAQAVGGFPPSKARGRNHGGAIGQAYALAAAVDADGDAHPRHGVDPDPPLAAASTSAPAEPASGATEAAGRADEDAASPARQAGGERATAAAASAPSAGADAAARRAEDDGAVAPPEADAPGVRAAPLTSSPVSAGESAGRKSPAAIALAAVGAAAGETGPPPAVRRSAGSVQRASPSNASADGADAAADATDSADAADGAAAADTDTAGGVAADADAVANAGAAAAGAAAAGAAAAGAAADADAVANAGAAAAGESPLAAADAAPAASPAEQVWADVCLPASPSISPDVSGFVSPMSPNADSPVRSTLPQLDEAAAATGVRTHSDAAGDDSAGWSDGEGDSASELRAASATPSGSMSADLSPAPSPAWRSRLRDEAEGSDDGF
ncbi:hypothetical protein FNF27_06178 [Cafeteria roenbergensis]|uniref:Uncharacterized protein n=1 Tax=Cafeteria roenbergensis TaxID=33653 RepID=A0A5A8E4Y5_CAFRO|nr:hypothetical protein FNF27_06178 [Cafeteria roenbergensis]